MAFKVSYNITAIDGFSRVIKKIQKNFAELNKKISGSGGVFKNANTGADSLASSLNNIKQKGAKASQALGKMSSSINTRQPSAFNRMMQNIGNSAGVASGKIGRMLSHMKPKGFGDVGVRMGAAAAAGYAVKEGSDIQLEQMRLAPFVGGAEKAKNVVNELRVISISTGQSIDGLASGLHSFLDVGMKTPEAMQRLKQATDIAAFAGGSVDELSRIFGDVKFKGRAGAEAFQVLKDKHLDLRQELAKKMNVDISTLGGQKALDAYIASGQVTTKAFFDLLQAKMAHDKVTGFASKAASLPMGELTKSWTAIKDSLTSIGEMVGNTLLPVFKLVSFVLYGIASSLRWIKDNFPNLGGVIFSSVFILAFIGKLLAVRKILGGIRGIFMGTNTVLGVLKDAAKAFVKPFELLWKFLSKILGFLTKIVGVAASFGLGAAKKAKAVIAPAADTAIKAAAKSPISRRIAGVAGAALAANPILDTVASIVIPDTMGDSTRLDKLKDMQVVNMADKYQQAISSAENVNKSHVKIEFEGKDAKINAIKQKDDSKNTFFDMSALGLNTFRGSY